MPQPKEKREATLYAKVKQSNKDFLEDYPKKNGYSTISEYVDKLIEENKTAVRWKKAKR